MKIPYSLLFKKLIFHIYLKAFTFFISSYWFHLFLWLDCADFVLVPIICLPLLCYSVLLKD